MEPATLIYGLNGFDWTWLIQDGILGGVVWELAIETEVWIYPIGEND